MVMEMQHSMPKPYLWDDILAFPSSFFHNCQDFHNNDVIVSKVAPAAISTVFGLGSSAIHHRKGFCEAV